MLVLLGVYSNNRKGAKGAYCLWEIFNPEAGGRNIL
ncbi:hypothetical protein MTY_0420 [Moorella thermoacetica Y72]|uniref:Uncharacterized protein n=1 Tax=Moorella thermoacetica Y72 TaxID=1325331 RepID=A0A0S6UBD1_NEOTH|nr:hypothetical protein MTY_0420 [Moorella thermoacetica Y72]